MGEDTSGKSGPKNARNGDTKGKPNHRSLSLRCTRCRFTIVVSSERDAKGLGWVNISLDAGTGLCRACRAETEPR
jgi:hypothetical protein